MKKLIFSALVATALLFPLAGKTTTAEVALRSTGIGIFTTFIMTPMVMEKAGQFLAIALKKLIGLFPIKK
ncbi:hypothetical protein [uncultured Capnocytophaga sp.]|uniref:hypothetical protein n=1 Tax=uncultured Capnocytophaga sp. TaxID=159273 RepID=UPI0025922DFB|nr:hypothetical protein [uncultured Capnocytophaga sp.]